MDCSAGRLTSITYQAVRQNNRTARSQAKAQPYAARDAVRDEARNAAARGDYDEVMRAIECAPSGLEWYYVCANAATANHANIVEATVGLLRSAWEMAWPLAAAVETGRWPIVEYLWREFTARYDPVLPSTVVGEALQRGRPDLERLIELCGAEAVAANMHDDFWMYVSNSKLDAAELLISLLADQPDTLVSIMNHAAAAPRSDILIYLCESGLCLPDDETMCAAVHGANKTCVEYLHRRGISMPPGAEDSMLLRQIRANAMWAVSAVEQQQQ